MNVGSSVKCGNCNRRRVCEPEIVYDKTPAGYYPMTVYLCKECKDEHARHDMIVKSARGKARVSKEKKQ